LTTKPTALAFLFFRRPGKHFTLQLFKLISSLEELLFQLESHDGVKEWVGFTGLNRKMKYMQIASHIVSGEGRETVATRKHCRDNDENGPGPESTMASL
jgi:hypothetical protein